MEKKKNQARIEYVRPKVEDIGPVTALFGANCSDGNDANQCPAGSLPSYDYCRNGGFARSGGCQAGTTAVY